MSYYDQQKKMSKAERKKRMKAAVERQMQEHPEWYDGSVVTSPTAGLTRENFAKSTEGYTNIAVNNQGVGYRYTATRELGIPDQIDPINPEYAAKDRMMYNRIDNPVTATYGNTPKEIWAQIYGIMGSNPQLGRQLMEQAKSFESQYGNPLYSPYRSSTISQDVKDFFGQDSFDMNWISGNAYLAQYIPRSVNGNVKAPTSKSSQEEWAGYYFAQIMDAENATQQAETEYAQLRQDIMRAVKDSKDLGLDMTVNEIIDSLDVSANYKTLTSMMDSKGNATPKRLNRAIGYDNDDLYGMVQAAMDGEDITKQTDFRAASARYVKRHQEQELYNQFLEEEKKRIEEANPTQTIELGLQDIRMRAADPSKPGRFKGDGGKTGSELTHAIEEALNTQDTPQKEKIKIDETAVDAIDPDMLPSEFANHPERAHDDELYRQRLAADQREQEKDKEYQQSQSSFIQAAAEAYAQAAGPFGAKISAEDIAMGKAASDALDQQQSGTDEYAEYVDSIDVKKISDSDLQHTQNQIDLNLKNSVGDTITEAAYQRYEANREAGYSFWQMDPQTFEVLPYYSTPDSDMPRAESGADESQVWAAKENYAQWQTSVLGVTPWKDRASQAMFQNAGMGTWRGLQAVWNAISDQGQDKNLRKNPTNIHDAGAEVAYIESNPEAYIPELMSAIQQVKASGNATADQRHIIGMMEQGIDFDDMVKTGVGNWTDASALTTDEEKARHAYSMVDVLAAFGLVDKGVIGKANVMTNTAVYDNASVEMQTGNWLWDHGVTSLVTNGAQLLTRYGISSIPIVGPALSRAYNAANYAGMGLEEARQEGADYSQQGLYALATGAINSLDISPLNPGNLVSQGMKQLGASLLKSIGREVIEENVQDISQLVFKKMIYDSDMKFYSDDPSEEAVINPSRILDTTLSTLIVAGVFETASNLPNISDAINYSRAAKSGNKDSVIIGFDAKRNMPYILSDEHGNPYVYTKAEAELIASDSQGIFTAEDVSESEVIRAAKREIALEDVDAVNAVIPDSSNRGLLNRALHAQTSKDDLDTFEAGIEIVGYEEASKTLSRAAGDYKKLAESAESAERAYQDIKERVDKANLKIVNAQIDIANHISGTLLRKEGKTLGSVAVEKENLNQRIQRVKDDIATLEEAGVEHSAQDQALEKLLYELDVVESRLIQIKTSSKPMGTYTARLKNAMANLDNLNQALSQTERACTDAMKASHKGYVAFQSEVSSVVDKLFGINGKERIGASAALDTQLRAEANDRQLEAGLAREAQAGQVAQDMQRVNLEENLTQPWDSQPDPLAPETEETVDASSAVDAIDDSRYKDIKSYLKNARISLSETQRQEASSAYDSYGAYRNSLWGKTNLTNDGTPLGVVWQELSGMYPDIFPADVSERDQVRVLRDVMDRVYGSNPNIRYSNQSYPPTGTSSAAQSAPEQISSRKKQRLISAQMIVERTASDFNLPVRSGYEASFQSIPDPVRAYYAQSGAISMRDAGDIGNLTHELGHHLNKTYDFTTKYREDVNALTNNLPNQILDSYQESDLPDEAIAEFVRYYVMDDNLARQFGGSFYDTFVKSLSRSDKRKLNALRSRISQYVNQTSKEKRMAQTRDESNLDQRSVREKANGFVREMSYRFLDNLEAARTMDKRTASDYGFLTQDLHLENKFATLRRADAVAGSLLTNALATPDGRIIGGSLADAFNGIKTSEVAELDLYLKDKRALDWNAKGRRVYNNDIDMSDVEASVQEIEKNHPQIAQAAQKIRDWYKDFGQAWLVDTGRMSQSDFDSMWESDPYYVPFRRVIDRNNQHSSGTARALEQLETGIRSVTGNGSTRDTLSPIASLMQSVVNITNGTLRNEVGKTMLWQLRNTESLGSMAIEVPASEQQRLNLEQANQQGAQLADGYERWQNYDEMMVRSRPDGTNVFGVVEDNGTTSWIQVNDPLLLNLFQNPNPGVTNQILSDLGKITRLFSLNVTSLSPKFSARNIFRDAGVAFRNAGDYNAVKFLINEISALVEVAKPDFLISRSKLKHSNDFLEWAASGGLNDSYIRYATKSPREILTKEMGKKPDSVGSWIVRLGSLTKNGALKLAELSENATRLNMYRQGKSHALKAGQSEASARAAGARLSREGTTDFSRTGYNTRGLSSVVPFIQAKMNGNVQAIRYMTDSNTEIVKGDRARRWGSALATTLCQSAAVALACIHFMDDEERETYKNMDPSIKYTSLIIPWAKQSGVAGDVLAIPYPQDLFSMFLGVGSAIADGSINGGVWDNIRDVGLNLLGELNPFSSTIFSPINDAMNNKTWYGGEIVPGSLQNVSALYQYDEDTSQLARFASSAIYKLFGGQISPMKIDYVLQQYGGALYDGAMGFSDVINNLQNGKVKDAALAPLAAAWESVKSGFHRNMITGSRISEIFYDSAAFLDQLQDDRTIAGFVSPDLAANLTEDELNNAYLEAADITKYQIKPLKEKINGLYDEMDEIEADDSLTDAEKDQQKSELRAQIYDLQVSGIAFVDNFKAKYCADASNGATPRRVDADKVKSYMSFNATSLPDAIKEKLDTPAMEAMQKWFSNTESTTFVPKYPPDFTENGVVPWDDVDDKTKSAMERVWTQTLLDNLKKLPSAKDEKEAKKIAEAAKSNATKSAKEIYLKRYKIKDQ